MTLTHDVRPQDWQRIVAVLPRTNGWGQVVGDIIPVVLACGHVYQGNATMTHKIGDSARCYACSELRAAWGDR